MKKKVIWKQIVSLMLAVLMLLGMFPDSLFSGAGAYAYAAEVPEGPMEGTCGSGITWKLTEEDPAVWDLGNQIPYKLTLSGSGEMNDYSYYSSTKKSTAPWANYAQNIYAVEIGAGITGIGSYAFYGCVSVKTVTLPDSVTAVGDNAFKNCYLLKTVNCGSGLQSIGSYAFCYTNSLETFNVSASSLNSIGKYAFYGSYLKSISLPNSLTEVGDFAFYYSNLQTVALPASVTKIGSFAFYSDSALKSITLSNVTEIGQSAFYNCTSLSSVDFGSRLETIGATAFYCCGALTSAAFGNSLKKIGDSAFYGCKSLSSVNFGNSLQSIGNSAFYSCGSLGSVSLPGSLTAIGSMAFSGTGISGLTIPQNVSAIGYGVLYSCNNLDSIVIASGNASFQVIESALYEMKAGKPYRAIAYPSKLTPGQYSVAEGTQTIDKYAFAKSQMTGLTLPDSVVSLGNYSFYACSGLASVSIGKNTEDIPVGSSGAFYACSSLKTVTTPSEDGIYRAVDNVLYNQDISKLCFYPFAKADAEFHVPDTVTEIGSYAVYSVSALKELYLPQSLESLGVGAIYGNTKLKSIYFAGDKPATTNTVIYGNAADLLLFKRSGLEEWSGWEKYDFAEWVPEEWNAENTVTDQGELSDFSWTYEAFNGRLTLTGSKIKLPDYTDSELPPWYQYMDSIQTIEASVQEIGDYAFYKAERLRRLSTDSTPARLGRFAFADCPKLVYISFGSLADIGDDAFSGDVSLRGAWSLYHVSALGERAFKNCSSITSVTFYNKYYGSSSASALGTEAFAGCASLNSIVFPTGLTAIGDNALKDCTALKTLTLPAGLTSIGSGAFAGCTALTKVDVPNGVTTVETGLLEGCVALSAVTLPTGLAAIGQDALKGCTALTRLDIPEGVSSIGANAFSGNTALEGVYFKGAFPQSMDNSAFAGCSQATLFYLSKKDEGEQWASLGGFWNERPVKALDRFFTEGKDYYSFSNSKASFGYDADYRIPRQRYIDVLDNIVTGTYYYSINKSWDGSCYGMASTALEFYENIYNNQKFDLKNFSSSVNSVYDIAAPNDPGNEFGNDLRKLIEAYQISQYQPQISSCSGEIIKNMNNYAGLEERIKAFQSTGGLTIDSEATPIVIAVYSLFGGHALVPVSWEQTDSGDFEVKVYDCNKPQGLQTLTINRERNGFEYGCYDLAISFIDYTAIAGGMSGVQLYDAEKDNSTYLSVDKASGSITDASGKGIDEIKDAYEQKSFTDDEDVFSGIKSYVLPDGNYTIAADASVEADDETQEKSITFYMAAGEVFAEVTASDENSALSVNSSDSSDDKVALTISSGEGAKADETVSVTLVNDSGMEREIDIAGYNNEDIRVAVDQEDGITVTAPESTDILVDGAPVNLENGQASFRFVSAERENPFKLAELTIDAECDEKNRLSGVVAADVIYASQEALESATFIAEYFDKDNRLIASYSERQTLNPGVNFIVLSPEDLKTKFAQEEGEADIFCRLTVSDQNNYSNSAISETVQVTLTKQPDTPEPDDPEPDDPTPDDPTPDNPNPDAPEPDDPNPDDSNPDASNPDDSEQNDPYTPSQDNPQTENPGTKEPEASAGQNNGNQTPAAPGDGNQTADSGSGTQQDIPVTSVSVSPSSVTIGVGETFRAAVSVAPANASNQTLTFMASNKKITVDKKGKITGKKTGTSWVIVRTENGKKASMKVKVKKAPKRISLNAKKKELKKGESFKIKVKLPKNTASHKITFSSSKKSVAKVNSSGKVTAVKKGSAVITVKTFNGKKAKLKITVK